MKQHNSTILNLLAVAGLAGMAQAATVRVTIESLAPTHGTYLTPFWVGFHDGAFDLFDSGSAASASLERLAEDGDPSSLMTSFAGSGHGSMQGVIPGTGGIPPFAPGDMGSMDFSVNPFAADGRYLSFAAMAIPSNDAFVGNANPTMIQVFQADGTFVGGTFVIAGSGIWDAGTEVNDEAPVNTAFLGQTTPDTGTVEAGVVSPHSGFLPVGSGGILDEPMFAGADFTAPGYQVARITVSQVPEPETYGVLAALGLVGFGLLRARRKHA
ncbi:MAG: spondin domain-containing protein [Verrucomicrobiales bacterium]|nr:spondin domain-containing protein [Verrucomicrobiales bacterium]